MLYSFIIQKRYLIYKLHVQLAKHYFIAILQLHWQRIARVTRVW